MNSRIAMSRDCNQIDNFDCMRLLLLLVLSLNFTTSAPTRRRNSYCHNIAFKTGPWSAEEDALLISMHTALPKKNGKNDWVTIAEKLHRRPKLIREHYFAKLDPSLRFHTNRVDNFTSMDDAMYEEAVKVSITTQKSIKWSALARAMRRTRLGVYFHYHRLQKTTKNAKVRYEEGGESDGSDVEDESNYEAVDESELSDLMSEQEPSASDVYSQQPYTRSARKTIMQQRIGTDRSETQSIYRTDESFEEQCAQTNSVEVSADELLSDTTCNSVVIDATSCDWPAPPPVIAPVNRLSNAAKQSDTITDESECTFDDVMEGILSECRAIF